MSPLTAASAPVEALAALRETTMDAAHYGPSPVLSHRYRELRAWIQAHYPEVRPFLGDAPARARDMNGSPDELTDLLRAPTLDLLLQGDPERLIGLLGRALAASGQA